MRIFGAILIGLVSCPLAAQDATELAVARDVLAGIQEKSFAKGAEYCGYIGFNEQAQMVASEPVEGTKDSCGAPYPRNLAVTASYHTHGDFDAGYFNEVPSKVDVDGDREVYMNGYVATPGGRLWFIDTQVMTITQVCGVGCLPVAPTFRKGANGAIATSYSYQELVEKLGD